MVARCSHLLRFVPFDSLLDNCMARASDHSALATLAALQLSPETQVWFCLWQMRLTLQTPCAYILHCKARCNGDDHGLSNANSDVGHLICHCRTKPLPIVWRVVHSPPRRHAICINSSITQVVQSCGMAGLARPQVR